MPTAIRPPMSIATIAKESSEQLSRALAGKKKTDFRLSVGGSNEDIVLPAPAIQLLLEGLTELARGNEVKVLPVQSELTTQEAGELLNLSRQYIVRLLDEGKIPSHKVGTHRRVRLDDVLAYKQTLDADRLDALKKLVEEAQELQMGY